MLVVMGKLCITKKRASMNERKNLCKDEGKIKRAEVAFI